MSTDPRIEVIAKALNEWSRRGNEKARAVLAALDAYEREHAATKAEAEVARLQQRVEELETARRVHKQRIDDYDEEVEKLQRFREAVQALAREDASRKPPTNFERLQGAREGVPTSTR